MTCPHCGSRVFFNTLHGDLADLTIPRSEHDAKLERAELRRKHVRLMYEYTHEMQLDAIARHAASEGRRFR